MEKQLNVDILIPLIEARPLLWDKAHVNYKDRKATQEAWDEICTELDCNFESYYPDEKYLISKAVIRRWVNIRDAFIKILKREKRIKESDPNALVIRRYVYAKQMKFLARVYGLDPSDNSSSVETTILDGDERRNTYIASDTKSHRIEPIETADSKTLNDDQRNRKESPETKLSRIELGSRKRKISDVGTQLIENSENLEDRHICFFKGIVPYLHTFTEDETIEFQMKILQVVSNIKQGRIQ